MAARTASPDTIQAALASSADGTFEPTWSAAYPKARSEPKSISRDDVLRLMKSDTALGEDFVLIDLRREDFEGGTIMDSINLPAQSIYLTTPSLYSLFKAAGKRRVIWYCGSSLHRGNWAAAWFDDYITKQGDTAMQSLVLTGGIKGWVAGNGEFVRYMQEYDESKW